MAELYWVKAEGFPWWPVFVVPNDSETPEGYTRVQYFGSGDGGYIDVTDSATVSRFDDGDVTKLETDDPLLQQAIDEALQTHAAAVEPHADDEAERAALKAARREQREQKRSKDERRKVHRTEKHGTPNSPSDTHEWTAHPTTQIAKRRVETDELLSVTENVRQIVTDESSSDVRVAEAIRPLASISVSPKQLYETKVGCLLSAIVDQHKWPHAAVLAAGVLQFWFFELDKSLRDRLMPTE
jgi:hypothetical protein